MLRHNSKHKEETESIFKEMIYNLNFIDVEVNGNYRSKLMEKGKGGGYDYLLAVELFALQVLMIRLPPFHILNFHFDAQYDLVTTPIGKSLIDLLPRTSGMYGCINLSPYVNAFFKAKTETYIDFFGIVKRLNNRKMVDIRDVEKCCEFIACFRNLLESEEVKADYISRKSKVNATNKAATQYVDSLFANRDGLIVVSIDLGESLKQLCTSMSMQDSANIIRHKFQLFLKNCRSKKPTSLMIGYLGKLEHSSVKGNYARLIMFFDSEMISADQDICHEIGQYWSYYIAPDIGTYHCSPISHSAKSLKSSVCLIKSSDNVNRNLLCKSVVPYITKSRMFISHRELSGTDLFFRGKIKRPSL